MEEFKRKREQAMAAKAAAPAAPQPVQPRVRKTDVKPITVINPAMNAHKQNSEQKDAMEGRLPGAVPPPPPPEVKAIPAVRQFKTGQAASYWSPDQGMTTNPLAAALPGWVSVSLL